MTYASLGRSAKTHGFPLARANRGILDRALRCSRKPLWCCPNHAYLRCRIYTVDPDQTPDEPWASAVPTSLGTRPSRPLMTVDGVPALALTFVLRAGTQRRCTTPAHGP
eukprot:scaffold78_cov609-Prasinococcus_capsulatus_cf.AAC.5